jgi:tetratricopeptide (TPR) repeat protein
MKCAVGIVSLIVVAGCAQRSGSTLRSSVEVMREERTADKLLERGRAFVAIGDNTRAEQYLSAALDAGGPPAVILPLLVRVCVDGDRYRVALDYARSYLDTDPNNAPLRRVAASIESALGQREDALRDLRELCRADPDDAELHFELASIAKTDDPEEADLHFREYLRLAPGGEHARQAEMGLLKVVP